MENSEKKLEALMGNEIHKTVEWKDDNDKKHTQNFLIKRIQSIVHIECSRRTVSHHKDFLVMSVELGISEDQINLMNQDEYIFNRAKAKLVRQEKESVIAQGVYYGMAKIVNEMFGKKGGK